MPDREKVMLGLIHHCATETPFSCRGCPYYNDAPFCSQNLTADALSLLKDQDNDIEPIKSTTEQKEFADRIGIAVPDFWCGACHFNLIGCPKFCPNCGRKVKWDD